MLNLNHSRQQLARRPRRNAAVAGALLSALLVLLVGMLMVVDQLQRLDVIQSTLAFKVQGVSIDTRSILRRLNENHAPDCSEAGLARLRQEVLIATYQVDVGVLDEQQRLRCTTVMGVLPKPAPVPAPDAIVTMGQGEHHSMNFNQPLLVSGWSTAATVVRQGRFSTMVSPHVLEDLFAFDEGVLRIQLTDGTFHVVHQDPAVADVLMDRLGQAQWLNTPFHGYSWSDRAFVSSRWIDGTHYVSQFVVPLAVFREEYAQYFWISLLLGLMAGILAYGALSPILQRWGRLDYRIASLITDQNILCVYQPVVDMRTGVPVACEVLMRLRDGAEVLFPDLVLPAVDRRNLCWELDQAVVRRAVHELCHSLPETETLKVSFNFFPKNVDCDRLRALIEGEMVLHAPRRLRFDLEVIEQADQSSLLLEIARLKQAGYTVSIDDFGTGYSNLASVRALAPDFLKIDKSFVFDMEDASVRSSLIPEIISIARAVGAKVVAEGIENEAQRARLLAFGVDYGQGYLFARPLEIEAFVRYLRDARSRASD